MRDRQKILQRLLAVKSQMSRLDEARLAEIRRRKRDLATERLAMFDLLGDHEKTDALMLGLASRHLIHTAKGERELEAAEKAQTEALLQREAQKKALEKILADTELSLEREAERKLLIELGETLAARRGTSLG
jgi:hypothetical protein